MTPDSTTPDVPRSDPPASPQPNLPPGWLSRWPWATFLLPLIVYMVVGTQEPKPPDYPPSADPSAANDDPGNSQVDSVEPGIDDEHYDYELEYQIQRYRRYPTIYTIKIALTLVAIVLVWAGYRTFAWRLSGLSIVVGVLGVVLWIGLCHAQLEVRLLRPLGLARFVELGERSAFNPLEQLAETPAWAYTFLAIRFAGLALIVPLIEEFFIRGFLMRFVINDQWWKWPFGVVNRTAVIVGILFPMLMHPSELLAAFVWFSLITWLMVRTRNIWDCVVAHAVTNLLLGIYVVAFDQWQLM